MRASRGLKWENKLYKPKRSIGHNVSMTPRHFQVKKEKKIDNLIYTVRGDET